MGRLSPLLACTILLFSCIAKAQHGINIEKCSHYRVNIEIPVIQCDILGQSADAAPMQVAEPGAIFSVVSLKDDSIIIRFWKWEENPMLNAELCFSDSLNLRRKYFRMSSHLLKNTTPRYDNKVLFTAGNVLIPVKMRLTKFDFSKDFTIGPVAGIKMRLSHYSRNCINFLAGLGITSVTLNTQSTGGVIEEDAEVPALSPSLGVVFDFFSQAQAGIFIGWDFISNNDQHNFIYNGKTWLSFGLGFTILSRGDATLINSVVDDTD